MKMAEGIFYHRPPPNKTKKRKEDFDNHPSTRVHLWKSVNPAEKSQHTVGAKKKKIQDWMN